MVDRLGDIEFELGEAYGLANVWGITRDICGRAPREETIADNWEEALGGFVNDFAGALVRKLGSVTRIETIEAEVLLLKDRCVLLERTAPLVVPIETFAPEPYEVIKPFHCVVRLQDGEYIASFFDANLSASGDTYSEAVFNLKDVIVGTFEMLTMMDEDDLGPGPLQQKRVLEEFMQGKE